MSRRQKVRRLMAVASLVIAGLTFLFSQPEVQTMLASLDDAPAKVENKQNDPGLPKSSVDPNLSTAAAGLEKLEVKGRAPKAGYSRSQFGDGWARQGSCDMRNIILHRDMKNPEVDASCKVIRGTLHDPYSGQVIAFVRGPSSSADVQIDHVVALSDAWQKGAQNLSFDKRTELANDPLELLAVDGTSNQAKSDSDAATWLPPNKPFRCSYVARQIAIKQKYSLWVTEPEKRAMQKVLVNCPDQLLPG